MPVRLILLTILFYLINPFPIFAQTLVWSDDFTTQQSRWEWNYSAGTGYHHLATSAGLSVAELGVTTASTNTAYSDSSLHENGYTHTSGIVDMRLRYDGDNHMGTMGWGVWNFQNPQSVEAAWFLQATPQGNTMPLHAMVARNSTVLFNQPLPNIDPTIWHLYQVEFSRNGTKFYVDHNLVATTTAAVTMNQRIEIWVDNYQVTQIGDHINYSGYRTLDQNQILYIDYVNFSNINSPPSPSPSSTPTPNPTIIPGDANGDSRVDGVDFMIWRNHYNQAVTGPSVGDFNSSGRVDGVDFMIWRNHFHP